MDNKNKSIENYGLHRVEVACHVDEVAFMAPFLQRFPLDWECYAILLPQSLKGDIETGLQINTYTTSISENAYATLYVKLTKDEAIGSERLTEMNYRDMVVDNVRASGGDMRKIKVLGVGMILNDASRASIKRVFDALGKDILSRGNVVVTPEDNPQEFLECVTNNPFARGQQSMLKHRAADTGNAFIERFILMSDGYDCPTGHQDAIPYGEPRLNMVTVLGRNTK